MHIWFIPILYRKKVEGDGGEDVDPEAPEQVADKRYRSVKDALYCIDIWCGSVISSPVEGLMYVVLKVSTMSTMNSASMNELITITLTSSDV